MFKIRNQKRLGPQIANPQSVTFAEGSQILQIMEVLRFADLRNLFADRLPLLLSRKLRRTLRLSC